MSRRLNQLMAEAWNLEMDIEKLSDQLNRMRAKLIMLTDVDIPEEMTAAGSSVFTSDDGSGLRATVSFKVYGSLPSRDDPERRLAAIEYLKNHDGAELVTSKVQILFGKGDIEAAERTEKQIIRRIRDASIFSDLGDPLVTTDNEVHHSSLAAWGRHRIAENLPIDLAMVGLRGLTKAEVKKVKVK